MTDVKEQARKPSDCNHLKGTWERKGKFAVINCECGEQQTIIDVDSQAAFELFEGGGGAIQRFGRPLHTVTEDDEEQFQDFISRGFEP